MKNQIRCQIPFRDPNLPNHLALKGYRALEKFWAANCGLGSVPLFEGPIDHLTHLFLDNNQIVDIGVLSHCGNLTRLNLSRNQIVNIGALRDLGNLTRLELARNQIVNIGALSHCGNLRKLNLSRNQIVDISVLSHCGNLIELDLSDNHIESIDSLSHCGELKGLGLSHNPIIDLQPIENFSKIYHLDVTGLLYAHGKTCKNFLETLKKIQGKSTNQKIKIAGSSKEAVFYYPGPHNMHTGKKSTSL